MQRAQLQPAQNRAGAYVQGAHILSVKNANTGEDVAVYTTATGSSTVTFPLVSGSEGEFAGWVVPQPISVTFDAADDSYLNPVVYYAAATQRQFDVREFGGVCNAVVDINGAPVSGADDTDALLATLEAITDNGGGNLVLPGRSFISAELAFPAYSQLVGDGDFAAVLYALEPEAGVTCGGDVGCDISEIISSGVWEKFVFDGCGISTVGVRLATVYAEYHFTVRRVDGDGVRCLGQNNTGVINTADHNGSGFVWDNGAQQNSLHLWSHFNTKHDVEIRESAAATPGVSVLGVPFGNLVKPGSLLERSGSITFGTVGSGLSAVHQLAGSNNVVAGTTLYTSADVPAVLLKPNTAPGRSGDPNGRLYLADNFYVGSPGRASAAIKADAVSGGVAGGFNCDFLVIEQGHSEYSGWASAFLWGTASALLSDSLHIDGSHNTYFNCPSYIVLNGTGADAGGTVPSLPYIKWPLDLSVLRDLYVARSMVTTGDPSYWEATELASDPGPPGATRGRLYAKDASGRTKYYKRDSTGVSGLLDTEDQAALMGVYRLAIPWRALSIIAATPANTLFVPEGSLAELAAGTNHSPVSVVYLDPADFAVAGMTTKYRLRASVLSNATGAGVNLTFGLYPITACAGAANAVTMTAGTVQAGSTVLFTTPAASTPVQGNSGDFTAPAAGWYAIGVVISGTTAAGSVEDVTACLQARNV